MKKLISQIHNAVQNSRKTREFLKENSNGYWVANYPIAIINEKSRVEDSKSLALLDELTFFDAEGGYDAQKFLAALSEVVRDKTQPFILVCAHARRTKSVAEFLALQLKYENVYELDGGDGNFEAFVEFSKFGEAATNKEIETHLRDIMRSAKEIPSLKKIGFVWIATLPKSTQIDNILAHYFIDNHIYVQQGRKISYIAWAERLADVNMRYFVNTP